MFHSISWQSYWLTLALLTAGYYLAIYLLYFRSDFNIRIHRNSRSTPSSMPDPIMHQEQQTDHPVPSSLFDTDGATEFRMPNDDTPDAVVYSCLDELTAFFVEAKRRKWTKEELIQALHGVLQKYPTLKTSDYRESLSIVIATQSKNYCSIHLQAEDRVRVW